MLFSNKAAISVWPEVSFSSLSGSAACSASMIFQSLVKGAKIDATFDTRMLKLMLELGTFQCFFLIKGWYVFVIGLKFLNVFIQFLSPFHVMRNWIGRQYLFMIYELAYICWHMRLVELVSSIHFLCFYVLT